MYHRWNAISLLLVSLGVVIARAEDVPGKQVPASAEVEFADETGALQKTAIRYLRYLPADYSADQSKAWPLLLFLHGAGERGEDLELVKKHGPPKLVEQSERQKTWPFITVSPQCPQEVRWNVQQLAKLVDHLTNTLRVDRQRIYVTGLSMGGSGTWSLIAERPGLFAAAIPICGAGDPASAEKIAKTPVWIFVGDQDKAETLENSRQMEAAIRSAGGQAKITVYAGVKHDAWTRTYDDSDTWSWLLEQRLPDGP